MNAEMLREINNKIGLIRFQFTDTARLSSLLHFIELYQGLDDSAGQRSC